jgi:hypothetical protein
MLIMHPATLLKVLIRYNILLVDYLGSFKYQIRSSANRDNLTSSLIVLFSITFISLTCLMALVKNSSTVCNKNEDYTLLFLIIKEILSPT